KNRLAHGGYRRRPALTPTMLPVRSAILDIDGTLHPGSLGLRMLESLGARSLGDGGQAQAVFDAIAQYRAGALAYPEMVRAATAAYASAVAALDLNGDGH